MGLVKAMEHRLRAVVGTDVHGRTLALKRNNVKLAL